MSDIKGFNGRYKFLSNFYDSMVPYEGRKYKTAEAAFQAAKTHDEKIKDTFELIYNPANAKRFGRAVELRNDWADVKDSIMYNIVLSKFTHNTHLRDKLLDTGDSYIEETNSWGDTYWGVCKGKGHNKMGKILMRVRDELR